MTGIAGIVLLQRHLAPPRAEELARMAEALGGDGEHLVAGGSGTAAVGAPVHRLERGGWVVVAGSAGKLVPDGEGLLSTDPASTLKGLEGPFALAAWDGARGRLILARDRLGGQTLYYALARGRVCFATRVAAVQEGLGEVLGMDPVGLDQLFTLGAPVAPRTVFEGVEQVPPGHWVEIDAQHPLLHRFAPPAFEPGEPAGERVQRSLEAALVRSAGGYAGATDLAADPDTSFDHPAGAMLQRLAAPHGISWLEPHATPATGDLEAAVRALESPLVSLASVGERALGRHLQSRGRNRVVTTAGGGIVSGVSPLVAELAVRRGWSRQPDSARRPCLLDALDPERMEGASPFWRRTLHGQGLTTPDAATFSHLPRWEQRGRIRALYLPGIQEALPRDPLEELEQGLPAHFTRWHGLHRALHLELTLWLGGRRPGAVLATMGIEAATPWLEPGVVAATAGRSPAEVLRRALHRERRGQGGARSGDRLASLLGEGERGPGRYLEPDAVASTGLFDPERVERLVTRWRRDCRLTPGDHAALLAVVTTGLWARHCLGPVARNALEVRA